MKPLNNFSHYLEIAKPKQNETFDIRFEEIVSLIEQERLNDATPLIEAILEEGCLDIRLIMYLFYSQFIEEGLLSLSQTFDHILLLLTDHQDKISPVEMQDKHAQNSLVWLFSSIGKKLRRSERLYKEKRPDSLWLQTIETLSPEGLEELKEKAKQATHYFHSKWEGHPLHQHLLFLSKWLQEFKQIQPIPEIKKPHPLLCSEPGPPQETLPSEESPQKQSLSETLETLLLHSPLMQTLHKKLQTFELFIEKQDHVKAALIADDIKQIIETFDPTAYFPKLFSNYFSLNAKHIETLSAEWESKDSLIWTSLKQLYHTDLDAFIYW